MTFSKDYFFTGIFLPIAVSMAIAAGFQAHASSKLSGTVVSEFAQGVDNSNLTLTPVPGQSGRQTKVLKWSFMVDQSDVVQLKCGGSTLGQWTLPAPMGLDQSLAPYTYQCDTGVDLTVEKGNATTQLEYQIWYTQDVE